MDINKRISQLEELLVDYMHKQDFMSEEQMVIKGNLDRLNKIVTQLTSLHRGTSENVAFLMEKVVKITFEQAEMKNEISEMKNEIFENSRVQGEIKDDVVEIKKLVIQLLQNSEK